MSFDAANRKIVEWADGQVIEMKFHKKYAHRPAVEVKVTPLPVHAAATVAKEDV